MNFLLLLLAIVLIVKIANSFKLMERFDGTCITNFYPDFTDSSFSYQTMQKMYDDPSMTPSEISSNLLSMMDHDLDADDMEDEINRFWKDPTSENYPYYNDKTCVYSYMNYNS